LVDMSKQGEAAFRAWLDAQRSLWERWLESSRRLSQVKSGEEWQQEAERLLDQWEESARSTLNIPVEQTGRLVEMLSEADNVPREAVGWAEQVHRVIEQWSEAQRPLLDVWFTTARQFGPARRTGNWNEVMETWRSAAGDAARSQTAWAQRVMKQDQEEKAESGEKRASSSSRSGRSGSARSSSAKKTSTRGGSTRTRNK
jgi:hypothetical protein